MNSQAEALSSSYYTWYLDIVKAKLTGLGSRDG